jgi:hypothetical protein
MATPLLPPTDALRTSNDRYRTQSLRLLVVQCLTGLLSAVLAYVAPERYSVFLALGGLICAGIGARLVVDLRRGAFSQAHGGVPPGRSARSRYQTCERVAILLAAPTLIWAGQYTSRIDHASRRELNGFVAVYVLGTVAHTLPANVRTALFTARAATVSAAVEKLCGPVNEIEQMPLGPMIASLRARDPEIQARAAAPCGLIRVQSATGGIVSADQFEALYVAVAPDSLAPPGFL